MRDSFFHISFSYKIAAESQIDSKALVFYNKYRRKENKEASDEYFGDQFQSEEGWKLRGAM